MKIKLNQIVASLFAIMNILWILYHAYFFWAYHFSKSVLWLVMIPDWIMIVNMTIGIIGLYYCFLLFGNRLKMIYFLLIEIILFAVIMVLYKIY